MLYDGSRLRHVITDKIGLHFFCFGYNKMIESGLLFRLLLKTVNNGSVSRVLYFFVKLKTNSRKNCMGVPFIVNVPSTQFFLVQRKLMINCNLNSRADLNNFKWSTYMFDCFNWLFDLLSLLYRIMLLSKSQTVFQKKTLNNDSFLMFWILK